MAVGSIPTRGTKGFEVDNPHGIHTEADKWRITAHQWMRTAEMLAIDLGDINIAKEVYEDIRSGLYDKVRERINETES